MSLPQKMLSSSRKWRLKPIATFSGEKKVNAYTLRQYLDRIQRSVRECRL
jgi:hypothetical protein